MHHGNVLARGLIRLKAALLCSVASIESYLATLDGVEQVSVALLQENGVVRHTDAVTVRLGVFDDVRFRRLRRVRLLW